jgi:hypothetical protein
MLKVAVVYAEPLATRAGAAEIIAHVRDHISPACHSVTLHLRNRLTSDAVVAGAFDATIGAALMVWVDRAETSDRLCDSLAWIGAARETYFVSESVVREYACIDWPACAQSPGVTLLALLRKRAELAPLEFHERWQRHSVLSERIHPLTRYHRNAVLRQAGRSTPNWDGIVEERVATLEDLAPERFFRGEGAQEAAVASLDGYVDVSGGGIRCALMDEYLIRLPSWLRSGM